ncbi:MAG: hypothetical protein QOH62_1619 [Solirubrobacteraceae bacterium]|jgi:hypothetical protein|nr:hypothetical protein [Solirubrobacteraceae bacterium]
MTARSLLYLAGVATLAGFSAAGAAKPRPCFGAAARAPAAPCQSAAQQLSVTPSPSWAPLELNEPCTPVRAKKLPRVCWFGHAKAGASASVALVGDSHASAWRSAVAVLARHERWHGLTVRRSSCPFSMARHSGPAAESDSCASWVQSTLRWFGRHPEVHTVLVAASAYNGVVAPAGADAHAVAVDGFREALSALPSSVQRIIVLRDTPRAATDTLDCVARSIKARQPPGERCALPRDTALVPDAAAEAATQLGSPRYGVIDLTSFFCDDTRCYPVIGGVLVYKDISHMTTVFGRSIGPYLVSRYLELPSA